MIRNMMIRVLVRLAFKGQPLDEYPETARSLQELPGFGDLTQAEANCWLNGWYEGVRESVRMRKVSA